MTVYRRRRGHCWLLEIGFLNRLLHAWLLGNIAGVRHRPVLNVVASILWFAAAAHDEEREERDVELLNADCHSAGAKRVPGGGACCLRYNFDYDLPLS